MLAQSCDDERHDAQHYFTDDSGKDEQSCAGGGVAAKQGAPELNVAIWTGDAIQCDAHAGASKESDFHRRRGLSASSSRVIVMRLRLLIREVIIMRMPLQSADKVAVADYYITGDAMFRNLPLLPSNTAVCIRTGRASILSLSSVCQVAVACRGQFLGAFMPVLRQQVVLTVKVMCNVQMIC